MHLQMVQTCVLSQVQEGCVTLVCHRQPTVPHTPTTGGAHSTTPHSYTDSFQTLSHHTDTQYPHPATYNAHTSYTCHTTANPHTHTLCAPDTPAPAVYSISSFVLHDHVTRILHKTHMAMPHTYTQNTCLVTYIYSYSPPAAFVRTKATCQKYRWMATHPSFLQR